MLVLKSFPDTSTSKEKNNSFADIPTWMALASYHQVHSLLWPL